MKIESKGGLTKYVYTSEEEHWLRRKNLERKIFTQTAKLLCSIAKQFPDNEEDCIELRKLITLYEKLQG